MVFYQRRFIRAISLLQLFSSCRGQDSGATGTATASTTTTFGGAQDVNLGPLTTAFAPATSCSYLSLFSLNVWNDSYSTTSTFTDYEVALPGYAWIQGESSTPAAACYPSFSAISSLLVSSTFDDSVTTGSPNPYFSPGVCPEHYTIYTSTTIGDETRAYCAPTWYPCVIDGGSSSALDYLPKWCRGAIPTTTILLASVTFAASKPQIPESNTINPTSVYSSNVAVPPATVPRFTANSYVMSNGSYSTYSDQNAIYQYLISIRWKSTDPNPTIVPTSGPPVGPTPTPNPSPSNSGTHIGVGVGVGVGGFLIVCGLVYWGLRRRRNSKLAAAQQQPEAGYEKAELDGTAATATTPKEKQQHVELPSDYGNSPHDGRGFGAAELPGSNIDFPELEATPSHADHDHDNNNKSTSPAS